MISTRHGQPFLQIIQKLVLTSPLVLQASTFGNALPDRAYSFSTEVFAERELITFLTYIAARVVITKPYFVLS